MKSRYCLCVFILLASLSLSSIFLGPARAEGLRDELKKGKKEKITIKSSSLVVDNKKKVVIFDGNVNAARADFNIECRKMLVFYTGSGMLEGEAAEGTKISRIVATGDVRVRRAKGGIATADKAVFYEADDKIVLTGSPLVKRDNDFVQGDRITIFIEESRSVVESTGEKRVKAVIFPRQGE